MLTHYQITEAATSLLISPAPIIFRQLLEQNIDQMVRIAGDPLRLRPHCKTHKTEQIVQMELSRGITKHKCSTFAEAELLASSGVKDIFLAYNLVGPNIQRAVDFCATFQDVTLSVTADHETPIRQLGEAMQNAGQMVDVLVDIDTGQHRTGIAVDDPQVIERYIQIAKTHRLNVGGLHVYDGQNQQTSLTERRNAVQNHWQQVVELRHKLHECDFPVPRIVVGGTGSFPLFAELDDPAIELSPGTSVFHDAGYAARFPDLQFTPAALLLTRVISCPGGNRVTLDLGTKSLAADLPMEQRAVFPQLPDAKLVLHNEEHLVLETRQARELTPGDVLLAIPGHICPTIALHKELHIITDGEWEESWPVIARDRFITI